MHFSTPRNDHKSTLFFPRFCQEMTSLPLPDYFYHRPGKRRKNPSTTKCYNLLHCAFPPPPSLSSPTPKKLKRSLQKQAFFVLPQNVTMSPRGFKQKRKTLPITVAFHFVLVPSTSNGPPTKIKNGKYLKEKTH